MAPRREPEFRWRGTDVNLTALVFGLHMRETQAPDSFAQMQSVIEKCIYVSVCLLSILIALVENSHSAPGYIYFLLGPLQAANGWYHGRRIRKLIAARR